MKTTTVKKHYRKGKNGVSVVKQHGRKCGGKKKLDQTVLTKDSKKYGSGKMTSMNTDPKKLLEQGLINSMELKKIEEGTHIYNGTDCIPIDKKKKTRKVGPNLGRMVEGNEYDDSGKPIGSTKGVKGRTPGKTYKKSSHAMKSRKRQTGNNPSDEMTDFGFGRKKPKKVSKKPGSKRKKLERDRANNYMYKG